MSGWHLEYWLSKELKDAKCRADSIRVIRLTASLFHRVARVILNGKTEAGMMDVRHALVKAKGAQRVQHPSTRAFIQGSDDGHLGKGTNVRADVEIAPLARHGVEKL